MGPSRPPLQVSTAIITLIYLVYVIGVVAGSAAGRLSNRIGNGGAMLLGSVIFSLALSVTLIRSLFAIVGALTGVCAGFFVVHAAAAGLLNLKLSSSRGRANALYVLFYYLGGFTGITLSGAAHSRAGWPGVVALGILMLLAPAFTGLREKYAGRDKGTF